MPTFYLHGIYIHVYTRETDCTSCPVEPFARYLHQDYEPCFQEMIESPQYQNVASKMLSGHRAYDPSARVCTEHDPPSSSSAPGRPVCKADTADVIKGVCQLNFITIWFVVVIIAVVTVIAGCGDNLVLYRRRRYAINSHLKQSVGIYF